MKLEVRDVAIRYGSTTAISGINLDVRKNEIFGIIGPANAGKTSFLKAGAADKEVRAALVYPGQGFNLRWFRSRSHLRPFYLLNNSRKNLLLTL